MIHKKALLCLTLLCASQLKAHIVRKVTGSIILGDLRILAFIDGKLFALDGKKIRAMLIIRTILLHMLHGALKDGKRVGSYAFNNNQYTIRQLYDAEKNGSINKQTLRNWLKDVKQDFGIKIDPFLELGRGSKPEMLILIEESLRLHRRKNSILHMWAQEPEGDDMIGFNREVQSFEQHYVFLTDLLNFLDDLISSAPKARQQFLESLPTIQERKIYTQRFNDLFEQQKQKINNKA